MHQDPTEDLSWMDSGACRGVDPDLFFPEKGENAKVAAAREVCAGCEVREQCADYGIETHQSHGVWGGLTEREMQRVRRERRSGLVVA